MDFRTLLVIVSLLVAAGVKAQPLELDGLLPEGSQYSVIVLPMHDKENKVVYSHNSDLLLPPASTQKIVTALAAKLFLGEDYHFTTTLERVGEDLVFRFSGDPMLKRKHLKKMLTQFVARDKKPIKNIWLDGSAFSGYERGQGWPWDGTGACYSAPSAAITLDKNCVHAQIFSKAKPGNLTKVKWAKKHPVKVTTVAKIVTREQWKELHCDLGLISSRQNEYQLNGCMVQNKTPLGLKLAVQNPALFTKDILQKLTKELGIKYNGGIKITRKPRSEGLVIAQHKSASLPILVDVMMKQSDNLIADALFKTMAREKFGKPGTYIGAEKAVKAILEESAGIDINSAILADGSGLSRNNRMTVNHLALLIRYIYENDAELGLMSTFPVSGKSGTLKWRSSVSNKLLKGRLQAKTGSVFGTKNLAGVLQTAKGNELVVAQIVTNYFRGGRGKKSALRKFERKLYSTLHKYY